jgi:hypothetical protein
MAFQDDRSQAMALAGGALASALLELLVEKNILSVPEVRSVVLKAMNSIAPSKGTTVGYEATGILAVVLHDRFPQDTSRP